MRRRESDNVAGSGGLRNVPYGTPKRHSVNVTPNHHRRQSQSSQSSQQDTQDGTFAVPPSYQRHQSVATSQPSFHESKKQHMTSPSTARATWMLHRHSTTPSSFSSPSAGTNACYYSTYNGGIPSFSSPSSYNRKGINSNSSSSSSSSSSFIGRHNNSSNTTSNWKESVLYWALAPCLILAIVPWMPCQQTQWKIEEQKIQIKALMKEQREIVKGLDETSLDIRKLRTDVEVLSKENEATFQEIYSPQQQELSSSSPDDLQAENYIRVERAEEGFVERIDKLESEIQSNSQRQVQDMYGTGPHRVKIVLQDEATKEISHLIIKLALLTEMPHAVHHFLRMVDLQLWNDLSLIHGQDSDVIVATPMSMDSHLWAGQRFVDSNVTHMAFTEHSTSYPPPHELKYSVAFSGRPGGPDFYISLEDELQFHQHESVFGSVEEGREVLDRFFFLRQEETSSTEGKDSNKSMKKKKKNRVDMLRIKDMHVVSN